MATMWTELPSEVLCYILEKIDERDLKTFLAASAVCRRWRCSSSWVSSISFATYYRDCEKHHNYLSDCSCFTDCIRSVLARSKSLSKLSIDLGIDRSIVCDVLDKCNWLDTLQELHMGFGCTRELLQLLRSCSSLSVLSLNLRWIETEDLILGSLKNLNITSCISNEVIQLLMKRVPNLEYLGLCYYEPGGTFVINAPASVVRMELHLPVVEKLLVNAAGVKDMIIQAKQVELEAPLLEDLKLRFRTQIIKDSPAVRRLYLCLTQDCIVSTLSSCVTLSGIKTLCISTVFIDWDHVDIDNSGAFFKVMSKLTELEELELNFNMVIQLSPQGHGVTVLLPKLKTLALDCSVCGLDDGDDDDDDDELAKREDFLLEKFRSAWEYLKSVTPRAQVVIRNEHLSSLTHKVDLL